MNRFLIRIFAEQDASEYIKKQQLSINKKINSEDEDYLMNVNEEEYINYIVDNFTIILPNIDFDNIYVSSYEDEILAESFPNSFNVRPGEKYTKDIVRYHIPFSGKSKFLKFRPNPSIARSIKVIIIENEICFDIINFRNDSEEIKREAEQNIQYINRQFSNLVRQIENYNNSLISFVKNVYNIRKEQFFKKNDVLSSLGVPIKKRNNVPSTFSIPPPNKRKKIIVEKPNVKKQDIQREPTLDLNTYFLILQMIHDVGKQFERLPSTYSSKEEEHLRDHFLLILEPNFEGSATGETFNKSGKTDILLRHEGNNVFIAECKFWHGEKAYFDTISQLLRYLTWRDSKAAVILFVRNKDFSSVLNTVKESTPQHPNYNNFENEKDETWFNYNFHLEEDPDRLVRLAVMLYHIPKVTE